MTQRNALHHPRLPHHNAVYIRAPIHAVPMQGLARVRTRRHTVCTLQAQVPMRKPMPPPTLHGHRILHDLCGRGRQVTLLFANVLFHMSCRRGSAPPLRLPRESFERPLIGPGEGGKGVRGLEPGEQGVGEKHNQGVADITRSQNEN